MLRKQYTSAVAQKGIDLEDAIDLREIKNIKLANQLLKIRRKKKQEKRSSYTTAETYKLKLKQTHKLNK